MVSAFGLQAEEYAAAAGDIEAIITGQDDLLRAYLMAVARREAGLPVYGMLLLDDQRVKIATAATRQIVAQYPDYDSRVGVCDELLAGRVVLDGTPASELFARIDPVTQQTISEFFSMCTGMLVRSFADLERLRPYLPRTKPFELLVPHTNVPVVERVEPVRPGLVVWSPTQPSADLCIVALALSDYHGNVTYVSGDGAAIPHLDATCYKPNDARVGAALATASAVMTTQWTDPNHAIAFARQGYGILAPVGSGAHEFVRGAVTYDPISVRSMRVGAALVTGQTSSLRRLPDPPPPLARAVPPLERSELPLVTVVTPTFNRRDDLRKCLSGIAAQTYPNIESIVVNDCGEPVDDIVAEFPFARLIDKPVNEGCYPAMRDGWLASTAPFIAFLSDDDWFFPDAVERLAYALIRSGAAVAHGNALVRVQERTDDGLITVGFNASVFNETATPAEALICTPIAGHSLLWRRDIFENMGFWRMDIVMADQEVQLRAAQRYAFVYVDQMLVEWRIRGESSFKVDSAAEMERVFDEMHPVPGREHLQRKRAAAVENVRNNQRNRLPGTPIMPATVILPRPAPVSSSST
jgi:hypothetical protein